MAEIRFHEKEKDCYLVVGDLGFGTVKDVLAMSASLFNGGPEITVDLGGVERADSAGLALLLEWIEMAKKFNRSLEYRNIPEQILAIAHSSGLDKILVP